MRKKSASLIIIFLHLFIILPIQAKGVDCIGMDMTGKSIHAIVDIDTHTININGDILNIIAPTKGGNGYATQNFLNTDGVYVYDSFVINQDLTISIYQLNAVNDITLSKANLVCHAI